MFNCQWGDYLFAECLGKSRQELSNMKDSTGGCGGNAARPLPSSAGFTEVERGVAVCFTAWL